MIRAPLEQLVSELRAKAETYAEGKALVDGALLCRNLANRLESAMRDHETEVLTIAQAARERGESYTTTYRRVKRGKIPNAGDDKHPRVRRCDLQGSKGPSDGPDLAGAILNGRLA